jgi:hypothetical protein
MHNDDVLNIEICDKIFDISIDGHCSSGISSAVWGSITGDINQQTDLKSALDNKQDKILFDSEYHCYII